MTKVGKSMKRKIFIGLTVALIFSILMTFGVYASTSHANFSRVAARINGKNGFATSEAFLIKGYVYRSEADKIVELVNAERRAQGLGELVWEENNYTIAQQRAFEISQHFAHERPDGSAVSTLSERIHGENLATDPGATRGASTIMSAWMNSDGHKSNILYADYKTISVACVEIDDICYWVQVFSVYEPSTAA